MALCGVDTHLSQIRRGFNTGITPFETAPYNHTLIPKCVQTFRDSSESVNSSCFEIKSDDENCDVMNSMLISKNRKPSNYIQNRPLYQRRMVPPILVESPRLNFTNLLDEEEDDLIIPTEAAKKVAEQKSQSPPASKQVSPTTPPKFDFGQPVIEDIPKIQKKRLITQISKTPVEVHPIWIDSDGFSPISFDDSPNSARGDIPTCDTPSRLMLEVKLREAQDHVDRISEKYENLINEAKITARIRMQRLLSRHRIELRELESEFPVDSDLVQVPSNLKVFNNSPEEGIVKAKVEIFMRKQAMTALETRYLNARKELTLKQTTEVIDLNTELKRDLLALEERRDRELERPRAKLDSIANEFNSVPGLRKVNPRRGRSKTFNHCPSDKILRLSLKTNPNCL